MEIRLSFAVPRGNERGRENQRERGGLFAPPLIPFSPEASRAPAKIDQSGEPPFDIDKDKLGDSPTPKGLNMGKCLEL